MGNIYANKPENLLQQLSILNVKVPRRTKERKTHHTELWSITRFLSTYAAADLFSYPVEILHRDKPDLQINTQYKKIGIEVTESIPEQYAYVFALAEKHFPLANIEPSMFTKSAPKRSKEEILKIIEKSSKSRSRSSTNWCNRNWICK